jgi:hypothetical protein
MLLPHKDEGDLIREVARQAGQSTDKSLFSLLLRLEEKICASESDNGESEASIALDQQPPRFSARSRYIE